MNGGYVLIDSKGLDLIKGSTEQTISGIFARVKEAEKTGKPIYATNCVWDTNGGVSPINIMTMDASETLVICTASTFQIYVNSNDVVTIVSMV